jgi:protein-S-isoprenylcysteine O-methyltransferase Ste14
VLDTEAFEIFLSKLPDLRTPWRAALTVLYAAGLSGVCGLFFFSVDGLGRYAPLLSQTVMALVVVAVSLLHFRQAASYRERYGALAYRAFFYHYMLPLLVTWYACFFHPLFVHGPALLPLWLAVALGVVCLGLLLLINLRMEQAGFHAVTHGMDVYTLFPEETTVVHGEIYAYVRHPLYLSLLCGAVGLALFANNALALLTALLFLIPCLAVGRMEDAELVGRAGEAHRDYIERTAALVPVRRLGAFLRFLVWWG